MYLVKGKAVLIVCCFDSLNGRKLTPLAGCVAGGYCYVPPVVPLGFWGVPWPLMAGNRPSMLDSPKLTVTELALLGSLSHGLPGINAPKLPCSIAQKAALFMNIQNLSTYTNSPGT